MITIYLKAPTEQDLIEALPSFRENDEWVSCSHQHYLDVIGTLYDDNGTLKEGFHANLKCTQEIADSISNEVKIEPENPQRRFFGD